jgi:hypothetical protein
VRCRSSRLRRRGSSSYTPSSGSPKYEKAARRWLERYLMDRVAVGAATEAERGEEEPQVSAPVPHTGAPGCGQGDDVVDLDGGGCLLPLDEADRCGGVGVGQPPSHLALRARLKSRGLRSRARMSFRVSHLLRSTSCHGEPNFARE